MPIPALNYPPELPVTEHRGEILAALRRASVVIVCGDTGSGKTTQLPKMALETLRPGSRRRIACTQPRRLAAVTMAERVAEELKVPVGGLVGFRHRFGRKITSETRIEFMTDGVLLAETRFDPLLRAYETIIVDEAHERSLNVDFLLGILKRILERRRDLKVIVSSATLDVERFSAFFDHAPVVRVPGRLYPVEIGYRPPPEDEERDLPRDVAEAVAELPARDDVLVFLPGERDIRETADYLAEVRGGGEEIIPLLASLPAADQRRAFRLSSRRRIILATNVAETSVTIPGIRAVVDSGLARISRYIHRTQVQRLQIENVSQASARQRAGRCGRLGPGICLRLYSEEDLAARDAFTPPEVLRSSLAGVILTMLDLRLGDIERFPFLDPPKPTMVREGLRELLELGAIRRAEQGGPELTEIGRTLAKIPVEPRLARMLLAASHDGVLPSVLPLVAAMACEDPRRRPIDEREKADQAHARFRVADSDFLGTLALWKWWCEETKDLSQAKARKLCKATYLSFPKMREWRDLAHQLEALARRLGLDVVNDRSDPALIHRAMLSGLLGRIGHYDEEEREYRGAHGLRFALHPGSVLARQLKKGPRPAREGHAPAHPPRPVAAFPAWIMAGELVDTARLLARNAAIIDPRWIEGVAGPICKHSYHSPEWDAQSGFVRATEQVTLYGLVIVPARRCDYSRIDLPHAREIFIRCGLVEGAIPRPPPQVRENISLLTELRRRAERSRHPEFFDAERLVAHFDKVLPPEVASADALRKWLRVAPPEETAAFTLRRSEWWPDETLADRDFPDSLRLAGVRIALTYRHAPDDPEEDGVTCSVRKKDVAVLRLCHADWFVPGLLPEKVAWLLSSLPTALRHALAPLDEAVAILLPLLKPGTQSLEEAMRRAVAERWALHIPAEAWTKARIPLHLKMRFQIRDDETGKVLACSRDLDEALAQAGAGGARSGAAAVNAQEVPQTTWTFGTIPERQTDRNGLLVVESFPALVDRVTGVSLHLFPDAQLAARAHAAGVARLLGLALCSRRGAALPRLPFASALYLKELSYAETALAEDVFAGAVAEMLVRHRPPCRSREDFEGRVREGCSAGVRSELAALVIEAVEQAAELSSLLADARLREETVDSILSQLAWLVFRGFPRLVALARLRHYRRYLRGIAVRIERARLNAAGDLAKEARVAPHWERYRERMKASASGAGPQRGASAALLDDYRWMLEEYRVSVFAQELHTPEPVSPKRLDALWAQIEHSDQPYEKRGVTQGA